MAISSLALTITIICSILWGVFDGIRKHLSSKAHLISILFYLSLGFTLFFFIVVLYNGIPQWDPSYLLPALLTVIFNAAANLFYIKAIAVSPISSTVPFLAFTSLFTALTGFIFLGEAINPIQIMGILILVSASLIINGELKQSGSFRAEIKNLWSSFISEKGAHYMIAVSLLWALSAPFDKLAVQALNVESHGCIQSILIAFIYLIYLIVKKDLDFLKDISKVPLSLSLGSLVSCAALGLQFYAYQIMKVSIFESIKRGFALFTAVIIGLIFFKEKLSKLKIIGITLIVLGGTLILNG